MIKLQPLAFNRANLKTPCYCLPHLAKGHALTLLAQQLMHGPLVDAAQASHSATSRTMKLPLNCG